MNRLGYTIAALLAPLSMALAGCSLAAGSSGASAAPTPTGAAQTSPTTTIDPTLERPAGLDTLQRFAFDGMASGLKDAADKAQRGEDPTFACVKALVFADREGNSDLAAAATKTTEQCGREIPIAWATRQLDAAEAKDDLARSIGECATAQVALDTVAKRFTDPRVEAQRTRASELCTT